MLECRRIAEEVPRLFLELVNSSSSLVAPCMHMLQSLVDLLRRRRRWPVAHDGEASASVPQALREAKKLTTLGLFKRYNHKHFAY